MSADIEVREPLPGTPLTDPAWQAYWQDIVERTGGTSDKVNQGVDDAATAQASAETAQASAETAQTTAETAQGDATLALGQVQDMAESNTAMLKKANFLRQWYGS